MHTPINQYKVLVRCFTYNQSSYILNALAGFAMQQTDFPFVCLVMDDNSTDGEQQVLREWLEKECDMKHAENVENSTCDVVVVPHKNNSNCTFAFYFLKQNLHKERQKKFEHIKPWRECCEYEAICEGDDYWTDPLKLQKQVDYLDSHPDCMLVGSNGLVLWDSGIKRPSYFSDIHQSKELSTEYIMTHWAMPTASLVYRREILQDYPEWTKKIYSGDLTLMLISMSKGKIFCFSDLTCVYRKVLGANSASNIADANRTYVIDQHQLLYTEFDKWTDGCYHDIIEKVLHKGDLEKRYIKLKNKSILYAFLLMPGYTINKYILKYKRLKELIYKR